MKLQPRLMLYPANCSLRSSVLSLFLVFSVFFGRPQSMRIISTKEGLPQSFVSGIVQDDSSFVWIGTRNGLVRFDGVQYKSFQHNDSDTTSLASNLLIWIRMDRKNNVWIEHESGVIDKLDPVSEKITHFYRGNQNSPSSIQFIRRGWLVDDSHVFWGIEKGSGVSTWDSKTQTLDHFSKHNAGFLSDTVRGVTETRNGDIWLVSKGTISRFDKKSKTFTHWKIPYPEDYGDFINSDAIAIDIHERKNGELMWGDRRNLFFFSPSTQQFRTVNIPMIAYMGVRWIRSAPDGSDVFETFGDVFSYSEQTGLTSIGKMISVMMGDVKSFLVDRSGLIWMGTNGEGIKQIDLGIPYFKSFKYKKDFITDMLADQFGIDMVKQFGWDYSKDFLYSSPSYQMRSVYDSRHKLYVSLKNTVGYYDASRKQFVNLPKVPAALRIIGITLLKDDRPLVIGTNGQLMNYNPLYDNWEYFADTAIFAGRFNMNLLPQDIYNDGSNLWITTSTDGLIKMDLQTKQIKEFKKNSAFNAVPVNELLGMRIDPTRPDLLWIGSYKGLLCLNKKTFSWELYTPEQGLPDNVVYSVLSDRSGKLWLTTNKGICQFDPISHHIRVFRTEHGLPGDEFNRFHQLELPNGRLIFGGVAGWTSFDPLMMKKDEFEPMIGFTDLKINNKDVSVSKDSGALKSPLNAQPLLELPYDQNTVTIGFSGLEFSQPQELLYRYRLAGYDNDWVYAGKAHQASYTKIPPGKYTLAVNASNTSGSWSHNVKTMQIWIRPPWWSTTMAYICYSIILAGLIWTFIRFRVNRMMMKQEMELKERETSQLKELDDMKSRFFSNITHEFRTPLTLIMAPAEQLKLSFASDSQQSKFAGTIVDNARQLLTLVNHLMDLSKLEAKALKLHEQRGNPGSVVGSVVHSFEMNAQSGGIELSFNDYTGHMDCWFYGEALDRIVYNLVSNALKFTPAGGKVEVSLSANDELLRLVVQDSGIGIPDNKLPFIFDRFYQVEDDSPLARQEVSHGTGIGLAMVKELVTQMDGGLDVKSSTEASPGTIFTVDLPYRLNAEMEETKIAATPVEDGASIPEPADKNAQILVVEDSNELAGFIMSILSEHYQVQHALNGAIGFEKALEMMPDLVISDVMMPVMDGFEFCHRLKEDIRTSHIPVILLTARATREDLLTGLGRGANDYLAKPFHPTELLLRVQNLLASQQKLREKLQKELSIPSNGPVPASPPVQDVFLTKLYGLLDEHLDDSYFGVDQLVDIINMSRSSLHRKLKSITGMATSEVVRNYRLLKATSFLKEGRNSSDAAYMSGFGSPAYFTKCFREVYGMTPSDYIKQVKK